MDKFVRLISRNSALWWFILVGWCAFLVLAPVLATAARQNPEAYYQRIWCDRHAGKIEYVLPDKTRVDCLTDEYAVEVDFANKWAEAIGQTLYYARRTNREPGVLLIIESLNDMRYVERLQAVGKGIRIWYIVP